MSYLPVTKESLTLALERSRGALGRVQSEVTAIVVTGYSGSLVGGFLALESGLSLYVLRKPTDKAHGNLVEGPGYRPRGAYVFVDDLIDSGATFDRVTAVFGIPKYVILYKPETYGMFNECGSYVKRVRGTKFLYRPRKRVHVQEEEPKPVDSVPQDVVESPEQKTKRILFHGLRFSDIPEKLAIIAKKKVQALHVPGLHPQWWRCYENEADVDTRS